MFLYFRDIFSLIEVSKVDLLKLCLLPQIEEVLLWVG